MRIDAQINLIFTEIQFSSGMLRLFIYIRFHLIYLRKGPETKFETWFDTLHDTTRAKLRKKNCPGESKLIKNSMYRAINNVQRKQKIKNKEKTLLA